MWVLNAHDNAKSYGDPGLPLKTVELHLQGMGHVLLARGNSLGQMSYKCNEIAAPVTEGCRGQTSPCHFSAVACGALNINGIRDARAPPFTFAVDSNS